MNLNGLCSIQLYRYCIDLIFLTSFVDINHCYGNPCKNNGKCTSTVHDFKCECVEGYKGLMCDGKMQHILLQLALSF